MTDFFMAKPGSEVSQAKAEFADKIRGVVFDLDGTVYEGEYAVEGVIDVIEILRRNGYAIYFCTNNSTRTRQEIADKLLHLGIAATKESIYSAAYAAACYLSGSGIQRVSVLGAVGLQEELCEAGLVVSNDLDQGQALVIGLDLLIDYPKMASFSRLLDKNLPVIACNRDRWFPGNNGELKPGCGIMVALVEYLLGRNVDLVAGKPNTLLLEMLSRQSGLKNYELLIVGDSFESDIALADTFGSPSVFYAPHGSNGIGTVCINKMNQLPEYLKCPH